MKRKNFTTEQYLLKVLGRRRFCETHKRLRDAIIDILEENTKLKAQLKDGNKK